MITERRKAYASGKQIDSKADLLSIMLNDPMFQNDDEIILNESLTFFLAGSQTQASLLSNTLCYLIQNKEIQAKLRQSLSINFKNFASKDATLQDLSNELDITSLDLDKDDYLKLCMYESLRIEAPVPASSSVTLTEN